MGQWTGFFIFFSLVTSIYSAAHYYLYTWFVRSAEPPKILRRIAAIAFVFLVFSFPVSRIMSWRDFNAFSYLLMLVSSVWMGLVLYLFILCLDERPLLDSPKDLSPQIMVAGPDSFAERSDICLPELWLSCS